MGAPLGAIVDNEHYYQVSITWTGNTGSGTASYQSYGRNHMLVTPGKVELLGSADSAFRGDARRWTPEELFVGSLAACHMLWYLDLCAGAGIVVTAYEDDAEARMVEGDCKGGHFVGVLLRPKVTITLASDPGTATALHKDAHAKCFIANSVNFPVTCEPTIHSENYSAAGDAAQLL